MSGRPLQLQLRVSDAAAQAAYEAFRLGDRPAWASLPEFTRNTWRRVAGAALERVEVVGR